MQTATTILNVIQQRGQEGLPLPNGLYKLLENPDLYDRAYGKIYSNQGNLTPGIGTETADGMSDERIDAIISAIRQEKYRWSPARTVLIPKKNGKKRRLGIPEWRDRLLQEVIRSLLEAYYEPTFSNLSHGFRPNRGCQTALVRVQKLWKGTKWWIEGDISEYFDTIDHEILLEILGRDIKDNRFLTLIRRHLAAGYMEEKSLVTSISGTPQGGILSPLLSNIYLNQLDQFVETELIPKNTCGKSRRPNLAYTRLIGRQKYARKKGNYSRVNELTAELRQLPTGDPNDPTYRRLRYIRYADDFLMGYTGTRKEAEEIKAELTKFLRDNLKLELNQEKTLIHNAGSQPALFLGYEIQAQKANDKIDRQGRRTVNGQIGLRIPESTIENYAKDYMRGGRPIHIPMLALGSDFAIVSWYGIRLQGIVQYYKLAWNVSHLWRLVGIIQYSMLKTLAYKHQCSTRPIWAKYKTTRDNGFGEQVRCVEVKETNKNKTKTYVARFGGIPLRRDKNAVLNDIVLPRYMETRSDLLDRKRAKICEMCEATGTKIEVHHIHALKDLNVDGQKAKKPWEVKMSAMRRKTLMVCKPCHQDITYGRF